MRSCSVRFLSRNTLWWWTLQELYLIVCLTSTWFYILTLNDTAVKWLCRLFSFTCVDTRSQFSTWNLTVHSYLLVSKQTCQHSTSFWEYTCMYVSYTSLLRRSNPLYHSLPSNYCHVPVFKAWEGTISCCWDITGASYKQAADASTAFQPYWQLMFTVSGFPLPLSSWVPVRQEKWKLRNACIWEASEDGTRQLTSLTCSRR